MQEIIIKENIKPHSLSYQHGTIKVSGVKEVKSFDEKCIVLALEKQTLVLKGHNLSITELVLSSGSFGANGTITSMTYSGRGENTSFLKKLTK